MFGYVPGAGAFADSGFQGFDQVVGDGLAGDVGNGGISPNCFVTQIYLRAPVIS